jgi:hypothetical protein
MEAGGMSPRHVAKRPRVEWAGDLSGRDRKINRDGGFHAILGLKLHSSALGLPEHWGNNLMRLAVPTLVLLAAASLSLPGVAQAQFTPYQPIAPPRNPYAPPQPSTAPSHSGYAPIRPTSPVEPPKAEEFKPFKPYKPYTGVNPDETPSGLYPELHKHRKPKTDGF